MKFPLKQIWNLEFFGKEKKETVWEDFVGFPVVIDDRIKKLRLPKKVIDHLEKLGDLEGFKQKVKTVINEFEFQEDGRQYYERQDILKIIEGLKSRLKEKLEEHKAGEMR